MSIYPPPLIKGMKFDPKKQYMICIRPPNKGGGQVAVKQPSLEADPNWIIWEPEEFRDKPGPNELSHANLSTEEIVGLLNERLGIDIDSILEQNAKDADTGEPPPPTDAPLFVAGEPAKTDLPEKITASQLHKTNKAELISILKKAGMEADDTISKNNLVKMYNALYD